MMQSLLKIVDYFQRERHKKNQGYQEALERLHKAVHETNKYIKEHKDEGSRDGDREMELSNLWGLAAIGARKISKDLSERCYIKRGYWKAPDNWTYDKVKKHRIELDRIEKELGFLI